MTEPELRGLRVVVTRSESQGSSLIEAVRAAGGEPISLPLISIVDAADGGAALRSALEGLKAADWLAVLSPNAAHRIVGGGGNVAPQVCKLAVVGEGTAAIFTAASWVPDIVPAVESATGLLAEFPSPGAGRVVIVQGADGRETLAEGLRAMGWDVAVAVAYQNRLPEVDDISVERARSDADVVVFASPSAVARYINLAGVSPRNAVCIGATTAEAAIDAGFRVAVAVTPAVDSLMSELARLIQAKPDPKARREFGRRPVCE